MSDILKVFEYSNPYKRKVFGDGGKIDSDRLLKSLLLFFVQNNLDSNVLFAWNEFAGARDGKCYNPFGSNDLTGTQEYDRGMVLFNGTDQNATLDVSGYSTIAIAYRTGDEVIITNSLTGLGEISGNTLYLGSNAAETEFYIFDLLALVVLNTSAYQLVESYLEMIPLGSKLKYLKWFQDYQTRVIADSGTIQDDNITTSVLKELEVNNLYEDTHILYVAAAGAKLRVSGDNSFVHTLYDLSGNESPKDASRDSEAVQPYYSYGAVKVINDSYRNLSHAALSVDRFSITTRFSHFVNQSGNTEYYIGNIRIGFNKSLGYFEFYNDGVSTKFNTPLIVGKAITITWIGNVTSLKLYVNGQFIEEKTTDVSITIERFLIGGVYSEKNQVKGSFYYHRIGEVMTDQKVLNEHIFLDSIFPEIDTVSVDNIQISKYNYEAIANSTTKITKSTDNTDWATGAARWCFHTNSADIGAIHGVIFNKAARDLIVADPPQGFHVASESELFVCRDILAATGGSRNADGTFNALTAASYWCADSVKVLKVTETTAEIIDTTENEGHYIRLVRDYEKETDGTFENVTVTGGAVEEEKVVVLNLHSTESLYTSDANDVFLNSLSKTDFSDVNIFDENGNVIPYKILAKGNYNVVSDSNINLLGYPYVLSDLQTLIGSLDSNSVSKSTDDGTTWTTVKSGMGKLIFKSSDDTIYTHYLNKIYRSEFPYTTWNEVIDFSVMDAGDGQILQKAMVQLSTGELFAGRYQLANDVKIFKSVDNGLTWTVCYETTTYQHVHAMYVDENQSPAAVYAGMDGGKSAVMKSTDKGVTWVELSIDLLEKDNGVMYSESGFRLINGETSIGGGNSIIKTTDDVNFYPVLANGKAYYMFSKINGNIYSGGISTNDMQAASILRSPDNGESWETIFISKDFNGSGASDGYRYIAPVKYANSEYVYAGVQGGGGSYVAKRIYDGGDNYMASVILKLNVPVTGRTIKVESGYKKAVTSDVFIEKSYGDLIRLPLNEGSGTTTKELISNTDISIVNPEWVDNVRQLYEFYPAIHSPKDVKAIKFSDTSYLNSSFTLDLTGGFSLTMWLRLEEPYTKYEGQKLILLAFNPTDANRQIISLHRGYQLAQNTALMQPFIYPRSFQNTVLTMTVAADGSIIVYKNSGGTRATTVFTSTMDMTNLTGTCYLLGTPDNASIPIAGLKNFEHPVQHFELVNRVLTQTEVSKLYGGLIDDLI